MSRQKAQQQGLQVNIIDAVPESSNERLTWHRDASCCAWFGFVNPVHVRSHEILILTPMICSIYVAYCTFSDGWIGLLYPRVEDNCVAVKFVNLSLSPSTLLSYNKTSVERSTCGIMAGRAVGSTRQRARKRECRSSELSIPWNIPLLRHAFACCRWGQQALVIVRWYFPVRMETGSTT